MQRRHRDGATTVTRYARCTRNVIIMMTTTMTAAAGDMGMAITSTRSTSIVTTEGTIATVKKE